jgi:5'(3')-deoxyribonucleotidase
MKRIAVDMDEVLADALGEHLARYNRDHGESITKLQLHGKGLWEVVSVDRHARLEAYLRSDDFFEDLPVVEDSQEVLAKLAEHYEIFVATAAMEFPNSFGSKYRWLRRHFSFIPATHYVFCGDKSILHADYLIDDSYRHFKSFKGKGILFSAPHNARVRDVHRVSTWREIEEFFLPVGRA